MQKNLSYVIATFNKLPYLRISLLDVVAHKQPDEEIVVIDGGSTDGTQEFLSRLHSEGKIDAFVSEPDLGEGHADNKGIALATGLLVKMITDDDVFHFSSITECKKFMLDNPTIDAISTDGIKARTHRTYPFSSMVHSPRFEIRQKRGTPFAFCGLGLMIRRSSLPIVGYFDHNFIRMDAEYSLRMTAGNAKIAWYTRETYVHILNTQSNSHVNEKRIKEELERLETFYFPNKYYLPFKQKMRNVVEHILHKERRGSKINSDKVAVFDAWEKIYHESKVWLEKNAAANAGQFLQ